MNVAPSALHFGIVERFAAAVLSVGFATCFTGIEWSIGGLVLRPFDVIAIIVLPILLLMQLWRKPFPDSFGFLLLSVFLAFHTASAFTVSTSNGIREAIQTTELILFAYILTVYRRGIDWRRCRAIVIAVIIPTTIFVILWHVMNGHYVGWKFLGNTKMIFLFLPAIVIPMLIGPGQRRMSLQIAVLALLAVLVVGSGERKALLSFAIICSAMFLLGYLDPVRMTIGAVVIALIVIVIVSLNTYAAKQIDTLASLISSSELPLSALMEGATPSSLSNAQRIFALEITQHVVAEKPMTGLGTNAYSMYIHSTFPSIPEYLLVGVHNEFQRVLVENGIVGLVIYSAIWVRSALFMFSMSYSRERYYLMCYFALFISFLSYCFFEGSGNESFLVLIFVAMLPDCFGVALQEERLLEQRVRHSLNLRSGDGLSGYRSSLS
ncbi:O-antigen ligase family protein [Microvirga sp. 2YAF29]|uniref:O-antigen ligase family protein n=1 Tax=Microvirga sp. 2YAF29 TaxID=3233031 RepID=UPI003F977A9B